MLVAGKLVEMGVNVLGATAVLAGAVGVLEGRPGMGVGGSGQGVAPGVEPGVGAQPAKTNTVRNSSNSSNHFLLRLR